MRVTWCATYVFSVACVYSYLICVFCWCVICAFYVLCGILIVCCVGYALYIGCVLCIVFCEALCAVRFMCVLCDVCSVWNVCFINSLFFLLWFAYFFNVIFHALCVVCVLSVRLWFVCVLDRLCVWLAVWVMSVICDLRTVCGHAWWVCLTVCVLFTLRNVVHVHFVETCAWCVWGLVV